MDGLDRGGHTDNISILTSSNVEEESGYMDGAMVVSILNITPERVTKQDKSPAPIRASSTKSKTEKAAIKAAAKAARQAKKRTKTGKETQSSLAEEQASELEQELHDARIAAVKSRRALGSYKGAIDARDFTLPNPGGGQPLLEDAACTLVWGRRYGLIGRNGTGKSTMLRAFAARRVGVQSSIDLYLKPAGFEELSDDDNFTGRIVPEGKYYFTRNKSTIVAFTIGKKYKPGNGFKIIGGHTDSPNIKIKTRSKKHSKATGCIQLSVECYGGGLWHTWFDRDLGLSGRVLVRNADTGGIDQKLIKINKPIVRISNLAIHLQSASEREAFKVNKEDHLSPILALEAEKALTKNNNDEEKTIKDGWVEYQEPLLLELISSELDISSQDIVDFELNLFDTQMASLGGVTQSEFLHSSRLDNLASCFLALEALVEHSTEGGLVEEDDFISMIALFDHEEIGSSSATGAGSPIISEAVRRISSALIVNSNTNKNTPETNNSNCNFEDIYAISLQKSLVLSSDQAHAIHPNYSSKHEVGHAPRLNSGIVIKRNSNQRYATNGITGFIIREIAKKAALDKPIQEFMVRNDCACGSTIGPIISANTGIRAIDMGCPQLSMHSIRETMGVADLTHGLALFKAFFRYFQEVDSSINKDS